MKKSIYILILTLTLFSGNAAAQCLGNLTANITGGSALICTGTSPGTFTAVGGGESGSYTYLWYRNDISTGITTQTYNPGILTANTSVYCAIWSGICGPVSTPKVNIIVLAYPTAPVIGTIVQPTCTVSTGSVQLSGLPTVGDWTITISPGGTTANGNGATTTISGLVAATSYTFKVRNYGGCESPSSSPAVIQAQPVIPTAPQVGTITVPTCITPLGSVVLNGLPTPGTWTLTRLPNISNTGSGPSTTVTGLASGVYYFTVTMAGCTSPPSSDVTIPSPPASPSAPVIGTITQPTCILGTGSVPLSGLPAGSWTVTSNPAGITVSGSGTTTTISGILPGTYTFAVTFNGCISAPSSNALINAQPVTPSAPVIGNITQPTCASATGTVVLNSLPASGNWVLTRNPGNITTAGSGPSYTVPGLDPGTYTFTVTNQALCTSPQSSNVVINAQPPSPPDPSITIDCTLGFNHAVIAIFAPIGPGYQYSLDGGAFQPGTSFVEVTNGDHLIAVRNTEGCITLGVRFQVSCGCILVPSIVLSSESGSTCGTTPVTVAGNTFSNATSVTITENGAGSVDQPSITLSPFSFTYTPAAGDRNRIVIITVTSDNPLGAPCSAAVATYTLAVNGIPASPSVGTITHLSCTIITGSVVLNGLPSSGTWTLTRSPDNVVTSGTGTSTTVTGLSAGTYTFIVATEEGCVSDASAPVVINPQPESPTAPIIGAITHPTCTVSTGTVELSGLPATGTWILTRLPGGFTRTGTGSSYTVDNVPSGTFTYTVTNAALCVSPQSESFIINARPVTPAAPSLGTITAPTCTLSTGSVILLGLPATGTWEVTRIPGTVRITGTGISDTITGLPAGSTYNFTVKNADGCTSGISANVVIPAQPASPSPPVVGTITQPTYTVPTGSVVLSGLPSAGSWILTRLPEQVTRAGAGGTFTVTGLAGGLYHFTVTNSIGCVSDSSAAVRISTPGPPEVIITDPPAVCAPSKVDLTAPSVTEGSTGGLIYTYWTDEEATLAYATPTAADEGTYYIKGTTISGFFTIKPVNAAIDEMPVANAGPDQSLSFQFSTTMEAELGENETGGWIIESGTGVFADTTDPAGVVNNLSSGNNIMAWIVTRGVCPADTDKVTVNVGDVTIPTLITPNGDTKNEYFVILGLSNLGESELIIFDRRGAEVFRNPEYDNKWNGVDYNEDPLPNDTYFFVLSSAEGRTFKGYIVIRR